MSEAGVPKLRFAEFKEPWEQKRLGLFAKLQSGYAFKSERFSDEGIPVVRISNVCAESGFVDLTGAKRHAKLSNDDSFTINKNDILIALSGATTGKACIYNIEESAYLNQRVGLFTNRSELLNYQFLATLVFSAKFLKQLDAILVAGAQPNVSPKDIEQFRFPFPSPPEQQKIADFLGAVDARVGLMRRRRDALRAYKKGMMQRLFSQDLRFTKPDGAPFPDWQEKRLGEIFDWIATNSLSREMLTSEPSDLQNIHYGDIHTKFLPRFRQSAEKVPYIKPGVSLRLDDASFCCAGDVIIADASEDYADIGKAIEIIEVAPKSLVAGLHTYIARPKMNMLSIGFSGYLFQANGLRKQVMRIAQGISVLGISKPNLSKLTIHLPHPEEQQKIADALTALDVKIDAVTAQMEAMLRFKKGLLQQMFV